MVECRDAPEPPLYPIVQFFIPISFTYVNNMRIKHKYEISVVILVCVLYLFNIIIFLREDKLFKMILKLFIYTICIPSQQICK